MWGKPKRPEEPLSWERWFEKQCLSLNRQILYPCTRCNGSGTIYDPQTKPCSIEGNKLRPRITCPSCNGSKRGQESEWRRTHQNYVETRLGDIADYDHYQKIYDDLQLTEDQKVAIRRFL